MSWRGLLVTTAKNKIYQETAGALGNYYLEFELLLFNLTEQIHKYTWVWSM